jgi:hypothetical protein
MAQVAINQPAGWERALRVPAIGYRLRPWSVGSPQSLRCLVAALAVCAALLLAPVLCLAHCALMSSSAAHTHRHGAPALATSFDCELHDDLPAQPAPQPEAPLPRAVYELLPQAALGAAPVALAARALPAAAAAFAPQHNPAPPQRPPISQ